MALDRRESADNLNSLGFAKPPSQTRVVVAMSGGVDSSVAPRGRGDGLSALRSGLREYLQGRGDRRICRQLSGRRNARALYPVQRAGQVQGPAGDRARS